MEEISKEMDLRSKQHNSSISMREKHEVKCLIQMISPHAHRRIRNT